MVGGEIDVGTPLPAAAEISWKPQLLPVEYHTTAHKMRGEDIRCGFCSGGCTENGVPRVFYCSPCVRRKVTKEKNRIHTEQQECTRLKSEVNHSLSPCMNGKAFNFIRDYLADEPLHSQSIARLAQQLLTVRILDHKRGLEKLKARTAAMHNHTMSLQDQICATEKNIASIRAKISNGGAIIKKRREERLVSATEYRNSYVVEKLPTIDRLLLSSKSKLFGRLTSLFAIRTSKTKTFKLTMNYVPIVSPKHFLGCSFHLVNASLEALSKFLLFTSRFLLIKLPHEIEINDLKGNTVFNSPERYFVTLNSDLETLTSTECDVFCRALSCILINLLFLIEARSHHEESKSFDQLLQLDELCWALIYNDDYRSFFNIDDSSLAVLPKKVDALSVGAEADRCERSWLWKVLLQRRSSNSKEPIVQTPAQNTSALNFDITPRRGEALTRTQLHSPFYLAELFFDYFERQRYDNTSKANDEIWEVL